MKKIIPLFVTLLALVLPFSANAATLAQFDAWKKEFPAAIATDSANLRKLIAGYELLVKQVTPTTARKLLSQLKDKLVRDQTTAASILNPTKTSSPTVTAAMRAAAEETSKWLNEKFAPFLAKAPV